MSLDGTTAGGCSLVPHLLFHFRPAFMPVRPSQRRQELSISRALGLEHGAVGGAAAIECHAVEGDGHPRRQLANLGLIGDRVGRCAVRHVRARIGTDFGLVVVCSTSRRRFRLRAAFAVQGGSRGGQRDSGAFGGHEAATDATPDHRAVGDTIDAVQIGHAGKQQPALALVPGLVDGQIAVAEMLGDVRVAR